MRPLRANTFQPAGPADVFGEVMLRLDGVRKSFGSIVAVDGLTLEIRRGEIFGLLGPNGAGKTTTISIATGLLRADAGRVDLDGQGSPESPAVRARIGVATQALSLYDEFTARENLRFFGKLYGLAGAALDERVAALLARVGLAERGGGRAKTFSGGMKRRLNLAVALMHDPQLVLLDEPTAGVDPQSRNAIFEIVLGLRREGRTIVYTTHYMEEAQKLCDRVAIMDHGRLLALETVDNLIAQHGGQSTLTVQRANGAERRISADPLKDIAAVIGGKDVLGLHIERPDLESVFLNLTGRSLRDE
jgi:ABC-2 type transport system ATP-binding protein